jgi:UDP-glucuronate 4-epimerase
MMKTILLTGAAGFIGSHVAKLLLATDHSVIGLDNLNEYYDVRLKHYRLDQLTKHPSFQFVRGDVQDTRILEQTMNDRKIQAVIHLAAMAGIRYSQERPEMYVATNIGGTSNLLQVAHKHGIAKFVFASSSSVYSGCPVPFREESVTDTPISTYGATKKSGELLAHTYHALYGMHVVVLRYFTVFGPQGRPDMSYFKFIRSIDEGRPVDIHGDGTQTRDLTFVEDAARATTGALDLDGYHIINVAGGGTPISVNRMVESIATITGKKPTLRHGEPLKTDLVETRADISNAKTLLKWEPHVDFEDGIRATVDWHLKNREFIHGLRY